MDSDEFCAENQVHFIASANFWERRKVSLGKWSFAIDPLGHLRRISLKGWGFFQNLYRRCWSWRFSCNESRYELTKCAWRCFHKISMLTRRSVPRTHFSKSWQSFSPARLKERDNVYQLKAWWRTRQEITYSSDLRPSKTRVPKPFRNWTSGILQEHAR